VEDNVIPLEDQEKVMMFFNSPMCRMHMCLAEFENLISTSVEEIFSQISKVSMFLISS